MKLFALMGEKLGHSLSPDIHKMIFDSLGVKDKYEILEINRENLPDALNRLKALGYSGANVTIPYKEAIIPYIDEISAEAKIIGAVNTIKISDGKAIGYNTDYFGFASLLKRNGIDAKGEDFMVFGAGGAAKAVVACLTDKGAKSVHVISRRAEPLEIMKNIFPNITYSLDLPQDKLQCFAAINATPLGMTPDTGASPINSSQAERFHWLIDTVYNPGETLFLSYGKAHKKKTANGFYMLICQAIKAQEIFQNIEIDYSIAEYIEEKLINR